ncbi:MAG: glycosyltransferase family 4 protein [archaeon]
MRVLMFGWEFPPNNKGGLGTACYGLTKSLAKQGVDITLVLPKKSEKHDHLNVISTDDLYVGNQKIKIKYIDSMLTAYETEKEYDESFKKLVFGNGTKGDLYGKNLYEEVQKYAEKAKIIALFEDFDVIHCHDWMTFQAGINARKVSKKPLVVHVHATDFDRTGGNPNQRVYDIERKGLHQADKVIAVSSYTKDMLTTHYGIKESKVAVVHNGIEFDETHVSKIKSDDKVVLFLGRLTMQKGPDYFIEAARKVLDIMPNVKFVVSGAGEMFPRMVNRAAELGMSKNVLFTGHLTGEDINRAYQMADLYVMPSVSEPFGITPLEALKNNTPVLISKTSGVAEVLSNSMKVDFWDTDEMTNQIVSVLSYSPLNEALVENGVMEAKKLSWDKAAEKCIRVYQDSVGGLV